MKFPEQRQRLRPAARVRYDRIGCSVVINAYHTLVLLMEHALVKRPYPHSNCAKERQPCQRRTRTVIGFLWLQINLAKTSTSMPATMISRVDVSTVYEHLIPP